MNITFLTNHNNGAYTGDTHGCNIAYNSLTPFPHVIINYGCEDSFKRRWLIKHKKLIRNVPMINCCAQMSGYNILKFAEGLGVPIPETHCVVPLDLNVNDYEDFIIKEKYMARSKQRTLTTTNLPQKGEYIQKIMKTPTTHIFIFANAIGGTKNSVWKKSTAKNSRLSKVSLPRVADSVYAFAEREANKMLLHMPNLHFGLFTFFFSKTTRTLNFINLKYLMPKIVAFKKEMELSLSSLIALLFREYEQDTLSKYITYLNREK